MPSNKELIFLVGWIGVGLAALLLASEQEVRGIAPPPQVVLDLQEIDAASVSEVQLSASGAVLTLLRQGEGWIVPERYDTAADGAKVESLIEQVLAIGNAERRGTSASSHATFEVTDSDYRIELRGTGKHLPFTLTVGKVDAFDRFFARFGKDDNVYSVTPNLRLGAEIGPTINVDRWLDLQLTDIPEPIEITGFRMETEEGVIVLEHLKEETTTPSGEPASIVTWKVVEPEVFEADLDIVRALRKSVQAVRGSSVIDPARRGETGLDAPSHTLTVLLRDGDPVIIDLGLEGEDVSGKRGYFGQRRGDDRVFLLPTWMRTNLFKTLDQLRAAEPEPSIAPPNEIPGSEIPPSEPPPSTPGG